MKKLIALILALTMVFALCACGKQPDSAGGAASEQKAEEPAAEKPIEIKLTTTEPSNAVTTLDLIACCDEIRERTNGMVDIQVYADGQMLVYAEGVEAVMSNANLIMIGSPTYFVDYVPVMNTIVSPYLYPSREVAAKFFESDVWAGIEQECIDAGFYVICQDGLIGYRSVIANAPVTSLEDISKLSLRIPATDIMIELFDALGCNYQTMAFADVFNACQTGMLDGLEGVPLTITSNSLWDAIDPLYYSQTNHTLDCYGLYVGYDFWMSIPEEYRSIIDEVLGNWGKMTTANCVKNEDENVYVQCEEHGVQLVELSDEQMAEFRSAAEPIIMEQVRGEELLAEVQRIEKELG